jgi:hypothetical protein
MKYLIQMEFIPGNDQIWVSQLEPTDPIYEYNNEQEALFKSTELQANDFSRRKYRVIKH